MLFSFASTATFGYKSDNIIHLIPPKVFIEQIVN